MTDQNQIETKKKLENTDESSFDIDRDSIVSTTDLNIDGTPHIEVKGLNLRYGSAQAIYDVSVPIERNSVTAFIGPSGCGKSTLLRCLNRMNDTIDICRVEGQIKIDGEDIYAKDIDPVYASALTKAFKRKLKILCYDCKFSTKGIKLNNKINIKIK